MRLPHINHHHFVTSDNHASKPKRVFQEGIEPMVSYVSSGHKEAILLGYAPNPCPPGTNICWGTGSHRKGYECCDGACANGINGRPACVPRQELMDGTGLPGELIDIITGYVNA